MSNIISLNVPPRRLRLSQRQGALIDVFATQRRVQEDVFWLKENAELLNILECTNQSVGPEDLAPHAKFYETLSDRIGFFPQYYRFLLSIGLDLEDLGLGGAQMERLCDWVARSGLPEAELSDLQRAEARRLLARRGIKTAAADVGLDDRLRAFINRSATFALPNKKAAYELTHIVFYLSKYGRCDPCLDPEALLSLEYAGILAFLDQNIDLLAEICVALRQAGQSPSEIWERTVRDHLSEFTVETSDDVSLSDDYHAYLVATWSVLMTGHDDSGAAVPASRCVFRPRTRPEGALRPMSAALLSCADQRNGDWEDMRDGVMDALHPEAVAVLCAAKTSTQHFASFFEAFARVPLGRG